MPYIEKEIRGRLAPDLFLVSQEIETVGDLNFCICVLADELAKKLGKNYAAHNAVVGAMECAKQEYIRRRVNPYEDKKIDENGDIFGFDVVTDQPKRYTHVAPLPSEIGGPQ